jgi:hypothetical protein
VYLCVSLSLSVCVCVCVCMRVCVCVSYQVNNVEHGDLIDSLPCDLSQAIAGYLNRCRCHQYGRLKAPSRSAVLLGHGGLAYILHAVPCIECGRHSMAAQQLGASSPCIPYLTIIQTGPCQAIPYHHPNRPMPGHTLPSSKPAHARPYHAVAYIISYTIICYYYCNVVCRHMPSYAITIAMWCAVIFHHMLLLLQCGVPSYAIICY